MDPFTLFFFPQAIFLTNVEPSGSEYIVQI